LSVPEPFTYQPTAVQAVAVGQDTPYTASSVAELVGLGMDWAVQVDPFQRSASGTRKNELLSYSPTAVQAVADEQDTACSSALEDPAGFGVGWIAHVVPFHRSARVLPVLLVDPAAVQAVADGHDTPFSPEKVVPLGLGVCSMDQEGPLLAAAAPAPRKAGMVSAAARARAGAAISRVVVI
jgi:hypothetical protein